MIYKKHESDWFKPFYKFSCQAKDPREAFNKFKVPEHIGSIIWLAAFPFSCNSSTVCAMLKVCLWMPTHGMCCRHRNPIESMQLSSRCRCVIGSSRVFRILSNIFQLCTDRVQQFLAFKVGCHAQPISMGRRFGISGLLDGVHTVMMAAHCCDGSVGGK